MGVAHVGSTKTNNMIPLNSEYTVSQKDGKIILKFGSGEEALVSGEHSQRYFQVFSYINYTSTRIDELQQELQANGLTDEKKVKLQAELEKLQTKQKLQKETVSIAISQDGKNVEFKMLKDINVEKFKEIFNIRDGVFRQRMAIEAINNYYADHPDATPNGLPEYRVSSDEDRYEVLKKIYMNNNDYRDGTSMNIGGIIVTGKPDSDGKVDIDYSGCTMHQGEIYNISSSYIEDPKPKNFWDWPWGK